jgi:DNA invertase Pin-like site-specific DNA recombinase
MLEGRQPLAKALVVAKLDRLSRSLLDFASIMERAEKKGWSLAALDVGVDTMTPAGEMIANVMATFAQFAHGSHSCSRATSSCSERGTSASCSR